MPIRNDLQRRRDTVRDDESRIRMEESDPNRWRAGAVRGYGRNQDGTAESAYNKAEAARMAQQRAYLETEAAARATAPGSGGGSGGQMGSPGLADVLKGITTADRNPNYNVAPASLSGAVSGGDATRWGDAFVRTGRAGQGVSMRDALASAGQGMGAGSGVAVTESGRVIRVDPNYEYGVQQNIDDPDARAAVPTIAKANSDIERRGLVAKAMELAARGVALPEGKTLDDFTASDLHAMNVQAAQAEAQRQWRADAMALTKIMSGMQVLDAKGDPRSLSPDEIRQYVTSQLGDMPGKPAAQAGDKYAGLLAQEKARLGQAAGQTTAQAAPRQSPQRQMEETIRRQFAAPRPFMGEEAIAEAGRTTRIADLFGGSDAYASDGGMMGSLSRALPGVSLLPEATVAEAGQIGEQRYLEEERRRPKPVMLSAVRG